MRLIFALGNPGDTYTGTRHNVGFLAIKSYAEAHDISFSDKLKFKALVAEQNIDGEKALLAKPMTFYNLVGESYRSIIDFYKIAPQDTLIIHDELALPFGTVRTRFGGSDAGNNGIKSINQHGGDTSGRVRVGIGSDQRQVMGDTDFVLGRFTKDETEALSSIVANTHSAIDSFLDGTFEATTSSLK